MHAALEFSHAGHYPSSLIPLTHDSHGNFACLQRLSRAAPVARQKTVCVRTECSCYQYGARGLVGGRGRGFWCGPCLWNRMGQNLDQIRALPPGEWRCPCCLVRESHAGGNSLYAACIALDELPSMSLTSHAFGSRSTVRRLQRRLPCLHAQSICYYTLPQAGTAHGSWGPHGSWLMAHGSLAGWPSGDDHHHP